MSDLEAISQELKAQFAAGTWYEALIPHFADSIYVEHHPQAAPSDGLTNGSVLAEAMRGDHFGSVLKDARQELVELAVTGDSITASQTLTGTLPDGNEIVIPLRQTFTFHSDHMVRLDHYVDPADTAPLLEALGASQPTATDS